MTEPKYWWAAIWPDGSITRGVCKPPDALTKALNKTYRCVASSIQTDKDRVTAQIPVLEERYKHWGDAPWGTDSREPHAGWRAVRGGGVKHWRPKPKKKRGK